MRILIITGGNTSEREISLKSAAEIKKALEVKHHRIQLYDLQQGFDQLAQKINSYNVIFPVLHGSEGEDGTLYKFLHTLEVPFVGQDCQNSELAFDKIKFKKWCEENNLPTANWKELERNRSLIRTQTEIVKFGLPCVLKATHGGSSKEVVLLKKKSDLNSDETTSLLSLNETLYVEELLDGVEITVGILKDKALPVIEIVPPTGGWFDYQNKYSGQSQEIIGSPSVTKRVQKKAQELALFIHKQLKLGPYSRTDFIVRGGIPCILEVNSPCGVGMTGQSLFPKAALAIGLDFPNLVEQIVNFTLSISRLSL